MEADRAWDDGPREARRPLHSVMNECDKAAAELSEVLGSVEDRVAPFRLSIPRPQSNEVGQNVLKVARDTHSPMVDQLCHLRDNLSSVSRRLRVLLDELEV